MINGLEGIPGSGKSYESCVYQALEALKAGRKIITNLPLVVDVFASIDQRYRALIEIRYVAAPVRGTWDANRVDPATGRGEAFELFADGRVEPPAPGARVFGTVWCYWSDWKHPKTGQGPLFLIDECHVAMPRIGTDKALIEWYKLHRHFNVDVLLATQKFRQMCQDIAELMAMVIKVRKADVLGKADHYIRKVHAGYRGAVIQTDIRKYEPQFFALYRSHTQGNSVVEAGATDVAPLSVKLKRWTKGVWALSALSIAFCVWQFSSGDKPKAKPAPVVNAGTQAAPEPIAGATAAVSPSPAASAPAGGQNASGGPSAAPKGDPEPYAGKSLHLTGVVRLGGRVLHTFALSASGAVFAQVTSDELKAVGYDWEPKTDCMGFLRWHGEARALICDAPQRQVGSPDRPLVLRDGYGSDGRVPVGARVDLPASGSSSQVLIDGPGFRDPQSLKGGRG